MTRKNFIKTPVGCWGLLGLQMSDMFLVQPGGDGAEGDWRNQYEILDLEPRF